MNSQEIVKIIEAELKRQKIPKTKFYADVGIKSGHMSNWRTGNNDPSIRTLVKISEYLGLDLLGKKEAPPANDGEGRYGLREQDWWAIGHWFKHELDVMAHPPEYLANKSGIPLGRVEAFLAGNAELSKAELEALAKVIGKPLGEIIHGYATAFEKEGDPVDLAAYLQVFGSLSSEEQKDLVQIAVLSGKIGPAAAKGISSLRALLESQMPPSQD